MELKILELVAENFKPLRAIELKFGPEGRLIQVTGKNGQGKSSVLDLIWFLLKGRKAQPVKTLRNGAEKFKGKIRVGNGDLEFWVTRTMASNTAIPTLTIEMIKGTRDSTPQEFLDEILGALTFDPLAFIHMDVKEQVAELRRTARAETDDKFVQENGEVLTSFEAIAAANHKDYETRKGLNREVDALRARIAGMQTLEGLPAEKLDEASIMERLNSAGEANRQAQEVFKAKQDLGVKAAAIVERCARMERSVAAQEQKIGDLEKQLEQARTALTQMVAEREEMEAQRIEAKEAWESAPSGDPVDVSALTLELQNAQRTNRAIDARRQKEELEKQLEIKKRDSEVLTRRMEERDEKKRLALAKAKIPVEGLVFDEREVLYKGLPLEQLGEGEQIRISTLIGMAANPKLRVLCIRHGEALDEDGLAMLGQMAKEHNFQIIMSRVDSSGKVGIVMSAGEVVATNGEAK